MSKRKKYNFRCHSLTSIRLGDTVFRVRCQEMKEITSTSQLGYYEEFVVHAKYIVQTNDIYMATQFSQHVDFFLQFGNILGIVPKHDTFARKLLPFSASSSGMTFRLSTRSNAHLTVRSFSNYQITMQEIRRSTLRRLSRRR